jgi:hypothetical protein
MSLEDRLERRLDRRGFDECWEWKGLRHQQGYGLIRASGVGKNLMLRTHRVAWELQNGSVPDGMHILHRCDNPPCCNPNHLFPGTDADNMKDMAAKGRNFNPHAAKTHCPHGHPYSGDNLRLENNGKNRRCATCKRGKDVRYAANNLKGKTNDQNCHN